MDISFEEKSAWGSLLAIGIAAWLFFPLAVAHTAAGGAFSELVPRVGFVIGVIIVIEIVYHSIIAGRSGDGQSDERDAEFNLKADRIAGYVLAFGVIWIVGMIMMRSTFDVGSPAPSSLLTAIYLLLALTASEASKLVSQIWYYRVNA